MYTSFESALRGGIGGSAGLIAALFCSASLEQRYGTLASCANRCQTFFSKEACFLSILPPILLTGVVIGSIGTEALYQMSKRIFTDLRAPNQIIMPNKKTTSLGRKI